MSKIQTFELWNFVNKQKRFQAAAADHNGGEPDICARKHGNNKESSEAFQSIKDRLTVRQRFVLEWIRGEGDKGMTCDELSERMGKGENVYSGRFTELHIKGKIEKIGTRPTRSGCSAAVWKAV